MRGNSVNISRPLLKLASLIRLILMRRTEKHRPQPLLRVELVVAPVSFVVRLCLFSSLPGRSETPLRAPYKKFRDVGACSAFPRDVFKNLVKMIMNVCNDVDNDVNVSSDVSFLGGVSGTFNCSKILISILSRQRDVYNTCQNPNKQSSETQPESLPANPL